MSLLFPRENLPSRFKFKEYCPMVFRNLRERFGIDDRSWDEGVNFSPKPSNLEEGFGVPWKDTGLGVKRPGF